VTTEQEFLLFSLSNHQSTLFKIHPSLLTEISDSIVKLALQLVSKIAVLRLIRHLIGPIDAYFQTQQEM
jgi:hypothetical protein